MKRLTKLEKEQLKQYYIDGMTVTDICLALKISRETFYYHKNKFEKAGIDLDSLKLAKLRDKKNIAQKEIEFLNNLIIAFEYSLKQLNEIDDVEKRIEILSKYANVYYKLKAPINNDCKQQVIDAISKTIYTIANIAIENEENEVVTFLNKYSNVILENTLRHKK